MMRNGNVSSILACKTCFLNTSSLTTVLVWHFADSSKVDVSFLEVKLCKYDIIRCSLSISVTPPVWPCLYWCPKQLLPNLSRPCSFFTLLSFYHFSLLWTLLPSVASLFQLPCSLNLSLASIATRQTCGWICSLAHHEHRPHGACETQRSAAYVVV